MTKHLVPPIGYEDPDALDEMTCLHVRRVFEKHDNNLIKTVEVLKASRNTVRKYLEK